MGHWEGLRNRASLEDLEAWAAQLGFKLIIGITTEDALQRAFSLDAELGKLPPERAALVVELAQALGELEERDFRLIRGVVRQVIDGDKADQALYGHRPGKSKPA